MASNYSSTGDRTRSLNGDSFYLADKSFLIVSVLASKMFLIKDILGDKVHVGEE